VAAAEIVESGGNPMSSKSADLESESQELQFPLRPVEARRERVKNKVKTRQRHTKAAPKDTNEKNHVSPTAATLEAASQALEQLPKSNSEEDNVSVTTSDSCSINLSLEKAVMVPQFKQNGASPSPDQEAEIQRKHFVEAGLTPLCEGDTAIINDLLDSELVNGIFERVRDEVRWQKMCMLNIPPYFAHST
jgi:hypothetical protein